MCQSPYYFPDKPCICPRFCFMIVFMNRLLIFFKILHELPSTFSCLVRHLKGLRGRFLQSGCYGCLNNFKVVNTTVLAFGPKKSIPGLSQDRSMAVVVLLYSASLGSHSNVENCGWDDSLFPGNPRTTQR